MRRQYAYVYRKGYFGQSMKVILSETMEQEESTVAVVGTKGQIVIPQRFRRQLKITPHTKVILYRKDDKLVLAKLNVPPLEEFNELFREIDKQNKGKKPPTVQEVLEEIRAYRLTKRTKQGV
jgi:AbrB family looped-hinge helix DNA binding protein